MQTDIINIGLGFLEGFALIISPCILPVLPIIFAGSFTGSKKRPFGIIIGFIVVFALFTFFSRKLVQLTQIDLNLIRHLSFGILILLGLIMLSTYLTEQFARVTRSLAGTGSKFTAITNAQGGLWSGLVFGALIAIIWTPCAGPILAAVIVQTVIQQSGFSSFLTLLAFGAGTALPLLVIVLLGREAMTQFSYFKKHASLFRKLLGVIIILSVGYMIYLERSNNLTPTRAITKNSAMSLQNGLFHDYPAPAIAGIDAWINSPPLQLDQLKGKVVLVDFWTYSCINCLRTLPYLQSWYDQYHDKGLVIIGVHTPEFDFEKNLQNVKNATLRYGIKYPVALDNNYVTWQNFNNSYWPAHYLIDANGNVVYTHFGEGDYDVTENNIRYLLNIDKPVVPAGAAEPASSAYTTPETYLGYARAEHFSSPEAVVKDGSATYSFPTELDQNAWALQGSWIIRGDRIVAQQADAGLKIHFYARKVFVVMGNATDKAISVRVLLNGKPVVVGKGKDVVDGNIVVSEHSLYEAVVLAQPDSGVLEVVSSSPGLEVYTFTFG